MAAGNIAALLVQRVNREVPRLEESIKALTREVNFFATTPQLDGRTALERQNALMSIAMTMKGQINSIAGMANSVRRRDLGDQYGQFQSNYRAGANRIEKSFGNLDEAIDRLRRSVDLRMNDPTRWSADPVSGAIDTLPEMLTALQMLAVMIKGIFAPKDEKDE